MAKRDLKIGRKYAAALFEAVGPAKAENTLTALSTLATAIEASSDLRSILINPIVSAKDKKTVLETVVSDSSLSSFIDLVVEAGRTSNLPDIEQAFRALVEELKKLARVTVVSRFEASAARRSEIVAALAKAFGKEPQVMFETSPEMLGGLTIRLGDTELDSSFAGAIRRLAGELSQA